MIFVNVPLRMRCRNGVTTKQICINANIAEKVQPCYIRIWILQIAMAHREVLMVQVSGIEISHLWIILLKILLKYKNKTCNLISRISYSMLTWSVAGKGPFTKCADWLRSECCWPDACWCMPRFPSLSLGLDQNVI